MLVQCSETDPTDLWDVVRVTDYSATLRKHGKIKREIKVEHKTKMVKGVKRKVPLETPHVRTIVSDHTEILVVSPNASVKIISKGE